MEKKEPKKIYDPLLDDFVEEEEKQSDGSIREHNQRIKKQSQSIKSNQEEKSKEKFKNIGNKAVDSVKKALNKGDSIKRNDTKKAVKEESKTSEF